MYKIESWLKYSKYEDGAEPCPSGQIYSCLATLVPEPQPEPPLVSLSYWGLAELLVAIWRSFTLVRAGLQSLVRICYSEILEILRRYLGKGWAARRARTGQPWGRERRQNKDNFCVLSILFFVERGWEVCTGLNEAWHPLSWVNDGQVVHVW